MLEISRKYTYLPEVVVSSAGSSTTRAARHKMKKKRSRIYDLGVVPTRGNYMISIYIKYGVEQEQTYKILIVALHVIEAL
jgi:hypothetical protein